MKIKFSLAHLIGVIFIFAASNSVACKMRSLLDRYPIEELSSYDAVLVIRIQSTEQNESGRYAKTEKIDAEILQVLKGDYVGGSKITATHRSEDAHAVCPVFFKSSYIYLVPLTRVGEELQFSRFSLIVSEINEHFFKYVEDIENGI